MAYRKFEEFVNEKEVDKAKEMKPNGDTPPQGKGANPYLGTHVKNNKTIVRVAEKDKGNKKPLGDEATAPFSNPKEVMPHGEKINTKPLTVENFLKETRELTNAEFVNLLLEKKNDEIEEFNPTLIDQFTGRKTIPSATEVAVYLANALPHNRSARKTFIRELKNIPGGLTALLEEIFGHKEAYGEMVNAMVTPESVIPRRLAHAMNEGYTNWMNEFMGMPNDPFTKMREEVGPPVADRFSKANDDDYGDDMPDDDLSNGLSDGPPVPPDQTAMPDDGMGGMGGDMGGMPPDMGMGGGMGGGMPPMPPMGGMGGPGGPMGNPGDDPNAPQDPNDPNADPNNQDPNAQGGMGGSTGPNMGSPDMGQDMGDDGAGGMPPDAPNAPNASDAPDGASGDAPEPDGNVDVPQQQMTPKKEFAYHHMIREMNKFGNMRSAMQQMLKD